MGQKLLIVFEDTRKIWFGYYRCSRQCRLFGVRRPVGALVAATCRSIRALNRFVAKTRRPGSMIGFLLGARAPSPAVHRRHTALLDNKTRFIVSSRASRSLRARAPAVPVKATSHNHRCDIPNRITARPATHAITIANLIFLRSQLMRS